MRLVFPLPAVVAACALLSLAGCDQLLLQWRTDKPAASVQRFLDAFRRADKARVSKGNPSIFPVESGITSTAEYRKILAEGNYLSSADWAALGLDAVSVGNVSWADPEDTILMVWKDPASDLSIVGLKNGEVHILQPGLKAGTPPPREPLPRP